MLLDAAHHHLQLQQLQQGQPGSELEEEVAVMSSYEPEDNNNDTTGMVVDANRATAALYSKSSPLQSFYAGQTILVTGGTGFLGKVLIEKLLTACPDLRRIYLLIRPKKLKSVEARLEELFADPIYGRVKAEVPKFRGKVAAVNGDCSLPGLGLSQRDRDTLIREVSVVFHVAATVRFDEKLKLATSINVRSTADILELCKELRQLKALVHVSTAYANCIAWDIEEKFFEHPARHEELLSMIECLPEETLDAITPRVISPWPNTYAFTKALAEELIRQRNKGMPVGIFRPGIVVSSAREPIPGWIDNFYGPTGVIAAAMSGLLRTLRCDSRVKANVVPVDLTVNGLIASAWDVAHNATRRDEDMMIYNFVSTPEAPISWGKLHTTIAPYVHEYPTSKALWYLYFRANNQPLLNFLYTTLLHLVPALLIDALALVAGRKPRMLKTYRRIHKFSQVLAHFSTHEWTFSNKNVQEMWLRLDPRDQRLFGFTMRGFDWSEYFENYVKGVRIYLLKDSLDTLAESRSKWRRLYWMHQAMKLAITALGLWLLWKVFSAIVS